MDTDEVEEKIERHDIIKDNHFYEWEVVSNVQPDGTVDVESAEEHGQIQWQVDRFHIRNLEFIETVEWATEPWNRWEVKR